MWPERSRDTLYFLLGPGLFTLAVALTFAISPWPVPIPAQGAMLGVAPALILVAMAGVGVCLAPRAGISSPPPVRDRAAWRKILVHTIVPGAAVGALLLFLDMQWGFTSTALQGLGVTWVHVPLPQSLLHYGAGGVLVEALYRLIPLPILTWLISGVILQGRAREAVFWTLAALTSLMEPVGLMGAGLNVQLGVILIAVYGANLLEAYHLKRFGWPAPLLFRAALYLVWHCFGPYLLPAESMLYPGPH